MKEIENDLDKLYFHWCSIDGLKLNQEKLIHADQNNFDLLSVNLASSNPHPEK